MRWRKGLKYDGSSVVAGCGFFDTVVRVVEVEATTCNEAFGLVDENPEPSRPPSSPPADCSACPEVCINDGYGGFDSEAGCTSTTCYCSPAICPPSGAYRCMD